MNDSNRPETTHAEPSQMCGDWIEDAPGVWRCPRCGRSVRTTALPIHRACRDYVPPPRAAAPPPRRVGVEDLPCRHRGERDGWVECQLCGQLGQLVPVHLCGLHERCVPTKYKTGRRDRFVDCQSCADRAP